MAIKQLTLKSLADLDNGKIAAAFAIHAKKITDDCIDRPGSKAVREITLKAMITPSLDPDTGECDDVNIEFEIGSKVPKHRSKPINCLVRRASGGGQLVFNDLNEENASQKTLDQASPTFAVADPDDEDDDDTDTEAL